MLDECSTRPTGQRPRRARPARAAALGARPLAGLPPGLGAQLRWLRDVARGVGGDRPLGPRRTGGRPSGSTRSPCAGRARRPCARSRSTPPRSARWCASPRTTDEPQPRVLLVAPMSGHFATLLRATATTLLRGHDVFVTDWHNARDVALRHGPLRPRRVRRPPDRLPRRDRAGHPRRRRLPALRAGARRDGDHGRGRPSRAPAQPHADGRPDRRADQPHRGEQARLRAAAAMVRAQRDQPVPFRHAGRLRRVYPGFVQLAAFMNMNLDRHLRRPARPVPGHRGRQRRAGRAHEGVLRRVLRRARPARRVLPRDGALDLPGARPRARPAALARAPGRAPLRAHRRCSPSRASTTTSAPSGQTAAAHDLCTEVPAAARRQHLQVGVGHFGVFSGGRWEREVHPVLEAFITAAG